MTKEQYINDLVSKHGFTPKEALKDARLWAQGWQTAGYWLIYDERNATEPKNR